MSRQYNPAVAAYTNMDIEGFNKINMAKEPKKQSSGFLARSSMPNKDGKEVDYTNPVARVAKQMQVIRKYRDEINGIG